ncbi:caspase family protein [Chitinophaga sp. MM2321]|uniref:caspase family protein n=1 Tax=Chitinophaga sp. MM2321 TaxID=3137178 RepID=UPI0032D58DB8
MKQCWLLFLSLFILLEAGAQKISLTPKSGHQDQIYASNIAPNNKYFVSLDLSGRAIIWDIANAAQMMQLSDVLAISFAANSQSLYVVHKDKTFSRVGLNGKRIESLSAQAYKPGVDRGRVFYPLSGIYLTDNYIFDIRKGYQRKLGVPEGNYGVEQDYSPVLNQIAVAGFNGQLSLIDVTTGAFVRQMKTGIIRTHSTLPAIKFSRNGEYAVVYKYDTMSVVDIAGEKVIKKFNNTVTAGYYAANLSPDGKTLAWIESGKIVSYNIPQNKVRWSTIHPLTEDYGFMSGKGTLQFNEAGDKILAGSVSRFIWMDASTGKIEKVFYSEKVRYFDYLTVDKENMKFSGVQNDKRIFSWDLRSGAMEPFDTSLLYAAERVIKDADFSIRKYPSKGRRSVNVSPDKRYIMSFPDEKCKKEAQSEILVYDRIAKKNVFSKPCGITDAFFANTKPYIAVMADRDPHLDLEIYDLTTGAKVHTFPALDAGWSSNYMNFSPDDKYIFTRSKTKGFTIIDLETKAITTTPPGYMQTFNPEFYGFFRGFTPDGKYVMMEHKGLYFMELATGKVNTSMTLPITDVKQYQEVQFSPDGNFLFVRGSVGNIHLMNWRTKKVVANLYPDIINGTWAVIDMEGRFDGNSSVLSSMYHASDKDLVPLDAMFEKFYTPKLLARILNGEKLDPIPDINNLDKVPVVAIKFSEGSRNLVVTDEDEVEKIMTKNGKATLTITATSPGDGVSEIRLFRNGKLVETTRNLVVEDDVKSKRELTKTYTIDLVEGANTFKAIALNNQRTESKPVELIAQYQPDKPAPSAENSFQIHLLVVGINTYKNPKYNLNYALADATAFKNVIEGGARSLFSKVNTHFITDASASKAGIIKAFNEIKTNARPNDLFVFYYAGHGVLNDAKDFFLVPHDVTQMYGKEDALENNGFSASLLQQYSKEIKAQKQLFILDACQSAGALENVIGARGALEEKAIAQLARSTGTHWLTASGSEQFASEFGQLGHGAFTWCILQALKGEADNGDKKLTIKELDAYLQHKVPDVTEKHRGSPQYPASYSYGNDFPFFIVK